MSHKTELLDELPSTPANSPRDAPRKGYVKTKMRSSSTSESKSHVIHAAPAEEPRGRVAPACTNGVSGEAQFEDKSATRSRKSRSGSLSATSAALDSSARLDESKTTKGEDQAGSLNFVISAVVPVHVASDRMFNAFLIAYNDSQGKRCTVLRRYRQFLTLHSALSKIYNEGQLASFPRKRVFTGSSAQGLEKRRQKLEQYLQSLESLANIRSIPEVNAFLQEDLPDSASIINAQEKDKPSKKKDSHPVQVTFPKNVDFLGQSKDNNTIGLYYSQVKTHVTLLTEYDARIETFEKIFSKITTLDQFLTYHEFFKQLISVGKYLSSYPLPNDYMSNHSFEGSYLSPAPGSPKDVEKLRVVLQKFLTSMSEISSKFRDMKRTLLDPESSPRDIEAIKVHVDHIKTLFNFNNLITDHIGFRIESGFCTDVLSDPSSDFIVSDHYSFEKYFAKKDYLLLYNNDHPDGPYLIALLPVSTDSTNSGEFHMLSCTKEGNDYSRVTVTTPNIDSEWRSKYAEIISYELPKLKKVEWSICPPSPHVEDLILEYEKKDLRVAFNFKFGVLLCLPGQEREEDMFNNLATPAFQSFLKGLGDVVELSGYKGFAGGLDTRGTNSTGTHSIASTWQAPNDIGTFQIMYHVSTMLPFGEQDQNLAKKRHIGNDIVVIVFQEEGSKPFNPSTIRSNYIQIIVVIRVINLGGKKWAWKVMLCSAEDVPKFAPPLPYPPIFTSQEKLCQWLIYKTINGELAAYHSKLFTQQFRATWKSLLTDLVLQIHNSRKKKTKITK
ncbi:GTPase-activating Rap/Ran-GAP domain-like protein 3 [Schistocerca gregaria]|uniref:GTPase-activating Rap/Ran-GAP domain-like protein 3 n=1 Tax=Schistocerca gregaria TaxID=7010 RepID=UPI00211E636E|nr:GTPase-activating Rap/Ran-GAP domain-like protein 3 [Schistocerca gregaria]